MDKTRQQLAHWCAQVVSDENNATAWFNLGWWSTRAGLFIQAVNAYERALECGIRDPEEAMSNLASVYSDRLANPGAAVQWLDKALQKNPDYYQAVFNRAHIAEQTGDRDTARKLFVRAAALSPDDPYALARLVEADPALTLDSEVAQKLAKLAGEHPDALIALYHLQERKGHFAQAWDSLVQANEIDRIKQPAWPRFQWHSQILKQLQTNPIPVATSLSEENTPVFILGMFRTGSTLLEQILAAHPRFSPLGESEFWPREVYSLGGGMIKPGRRPNPAQQAESKARWREHLRERRASDGVRATDKRPDNLFHIATILDVLPEAKILVTERDWRDTLISVYGTRLHPQHGYATEPAAIADHISLCQKITDFWVEALPGKIRKVSYEALVEDPESTLQELFSWLGERWDPACLEFYTLNNSVRTASVWQVREPLGTDRKGRWRLYEEPLRKLFDAALDEPLAPKLST
ncbi:MAG: sulfotransferase [Luminiphilus sp.]|jgi:tetratricopeptide (TPR) repeat protein|nr:sulfotransferase [Luminiphilus sp.]